MCSFTLPPFQVGHGGYATVYRGLWHATEVAIKTVHHAAAPIMGRPPAAAAAAAASLQGPSGTGGGGGGGNAQLQGSFTRQHRRSMCMSDAYELGVMFSVNHPHIVQVSAVGVSVCMTGRVTRTDDT